MINYNTNGLPDDWQYRFTEDMMSNFAQPGGLPYVFDTVEFFGQGDTIKVARPNEIVISSNSNYQDGRRTNISELTYSEREYKTEIHDAAVSIGWEQHSRSRLNVLNDAISKLTNAARRLREKNFNKGMNDALAADPGIGFFVDGHSLDIDLAGDDDAIFDEIGKHSPLFGTKRVLWFMPQEIYATLAENKNLNGMANTGTISGITNKEWPYMLFGITIATQANCTWDKAKINDDGFKRYLLPDGTGVVETYIVNVDDIQENSLRIEPGVTDPRSILKSADIETERRTAGLNLNAEGVDRARRQAVADGAGFVLAKEDSVMTSETFFKVMYSRTFAPKKDHSVMKVRFMNPVSSLVGMNQRSWYEQDAPNQQALDLGDRVNKRPLKK